LRCDWQTSSLPEDEAAPDLQDRFSIQQPSIILEFEKNKDETSRPRYTNIFIDMEQVGNPSVASRLKPVQPQSAQDWEVRRPIIEELYWTDGRKLPEVMGTMKTMYNFSATYSIPTSCDGNRVIDSRHRKKQYKDQFKRWNFEKNIKTDEMKAIIRVRKRRRDDEGKDTQFRLRERPVPQEKIDRFVKRQKTPTAQVTSPGPSSSGELVRSDQTLKHVLTLFLDSSNAVRHQLLYAPGTGYSNSARTWRSNTSSCTRAAFSA
jgi:Clr5 domain